MSTNLAKGKTASLEVSGKGPVRLTITPVDATTANLEIGIDYGLAEVPHFHYDADYCDVVEGRGELILVFGRLRAGNQELRTKIEVGFSHENFIKQVWSRTRRLHETVRGIVADHRLSPLSSLPDPDKVQTFRSNNVFMAVLASESVIDFYYVSPGDIHLAQHQRKPEIALQPVVRVVVSTPLLLEFLDKCVPFAPEALVSRFGEEEEG